MNLVRTLLTKYTVLHLLRKVEIIKNNFNTAKHITDAL